jgi:TonB family protein
MSRVNVQGFAACTEGKPLPYRAEVVTELEVGPEGFVTDAKIVRSDDPCLNRPVLIAVRQWRYPPRLVEGELARREGVRALLIFAQDAEPRGVSPGRSTR